MSLLLTLNKFTSSSNVSIANFEQINTCCDDNGNNNFDNNHDEDIDRAEFTKNLFLYFFNWEPKYKSRETKGQENQISLQINVLRRRKC